MLVKSQVEGLRGLAEIKLKSSSCNTRGREVQGFRGLGVANWENCFYKTFLKWSNYCRKVVSDFDLNQRLRGSGVKGFRGSGAQGLRGLAETKLKRSFYKTILKWPYYYIKVVSDAHLHGRFMSYGAQGLRGSGVQKRGYPRLPPSEKKFFTL